jgi:hypothetical protein
MGAITSGPWRVSNRKARRVTNAHGVVICNAVLRNRGGPKQKSELKDEHEAEANASLIAKAPDHADIGWAMCVGAGRWEPWGDGRGEFCLNGICHATKLDEFGVPEVTEGMRSAIAKARGAS